MEKKKKKYNYLLVIFKVRFASAMTFKFSSISLSVFYKGIYSKECANNCLCGNRKPRKSKGRHMRSKYCKLSPWDPNQKWVIHCAHFSSFSKPGTAVHQKEVASILTLQRNAFLPPIPQTVYSESSFLPPPSTVECLPLSCHLHTPLLSSSWQTQDTTPTSSHPYLHSYS